ncbi:MAG: hypothetical protein HY823_05785 [Acidobacteria bacterium]|nr:hypothetical protein [Acidobacteriota bacterium]
MIALASPFMEFVAREHPALVHLPLGLVVALPIAMLVSFRSRHAHAWKLTATFMAGLAWASSAVALFSGLLWGRQINLIPPGNFLPVVASEKQVLQRMLQLHELTALAGVLVGGVCLAFLVRSLRMESERIDTPTQPGTEPGPRRRSALRRISDRGVGVPAMMLSLLWIGAWGFCGKLGGIMVFGNEETNKAAAEQEAKRKNDVEAELPIRALDYGSLEPVEPGPIRSAAHGNRWRRTWVTASGIDAYKSGKPLPAGAYVVLSTFEDEKGRPGHELGPLYMKETRSDGSTAFAFYWPRVPEGRRTEVGGEETVYWRSPDPKLVVCTGCHEKNGAGQGPAGGVGAKQVAALKH